MKRSHPIWALLSFFVLLSVWSLAVSQASRLGKSPIEGSHSQPRTVMAVGSSVAEGWVDTAGGYLARGMQEFSRASQTSISFLNKSAAGDIPTHVASQYRFWLQNLRPQVVIISWGGLDDIEAKTPLLVFYRQVRQEIQEALRAHAVVLIVTPPVTRASYTEFPVEEARYLYAEMAVARSFHSRNVWIFDVFDQMKAYLAEHHQTYVPYMADGWHPNSDGHILGGQLFVTDLLNRFGKRFPKFE